MIAYKKEKIQNAICFFALKHKESTGYDLCQTRLYIYLAFLDFESVKELGQPSLELTYKATKIGPFPLELHSKSGNFNNDFFEFKIDKHQYIVLAKKEPCLDYFSEYEIEIMYNIIEKYSHLTIKQIIATAYKEIKAWRRTLEQKPNSNIDYALTFDGNIMLKSEEDLTPAEEHYIIYKAIDELSQKKLKKIDIDNMITSKELERAV